MKIKKNLLFATSTFGEYLDKNFINKIKNKFNTYFNPYKRKMSKKELLFYLTKYKIDYVIAGLEDYDKDIINNSNLKIISRLGSGTSNIDIKFAKSKNLKIFSTPKAPTDAVAELTISMMLNLLKHSFKMNKEMHKNNWFRVSGNLLLGKTVLIVGFGNIGKRVAQLLRPFKTNVIIFDKKFKINKGNQYKTLSSVLPKADIITFHIDTDQKILGDKECKLLKKKVLLLNASRGKVIDEKALIKYVKNKTIKSAWIDVFEKEPYFGNLSKFENIILTPHIASYTIETRQKMEIESVNNILKYLRI